MDNKKKQLYIVEDESGLELSLGLSCGNSSSDKRSSPPVTDRPIDGKNTTNSTNNMWLDARRQAVESQQQGMHLQSTVKMREFLPEVHSSQQQIPWNNKQHMPVEFSKFLGKSSPSDQEDKDLDSADQKKFALHQEARKKRKMLIDEQKLQKKAKDDDKPGQDGPENSGLPPIHRVASLGTFQNRGTEPNAQQLAILASQLMMRRTISDPTGGAGQIPKEKEEGTAGGSTNGNKEETPDPIRAMEHGIPDDAKHLLSMWQLGTTVDVPPAERINPELTNVQPTGHIGGSGTSPDLPWVSATGPGGKTISGVAYKLFQGQYKIVCSCHGTHMSPSDFVKHAGNLDGNVKGIGGDALPVPV